MRPALSRPLRQISISTQLGKRIIPFRSYHKMSTGIPNLSSQETPPRHPDPNHPSNAGHQLGGTGAPPASTTNAASYSTATGGSESEKVGGDGYGIESRDLKDGPGEELNEKQRLLVGSVLDLFAGKPTLKKLSLWADDATFKDPLTNSAGRKQYSAQWYGLAAAFSEINRLTPAQVISAGNPIVLNFSTKYKVKGLGTEKTIDSEVRIFTDVAGDKITGVEDRWGGDLPEGPIAKVFRNLNAATVPVFVGVPKTEEEDAAKRK